MTANNSTNCIHVPNNYNTWAVNNATNTYTLTPTSQATENPAFEIRDNNVPILTFYKNGTIATPDGTITVKSWIETIKIMRRLLIDLSQDSELSEKFPYLKDAAHQWMMDSLTGDDKDK